MQKKKIQDIISEESPLRHNPFDRLKALQKQKAALPGPKPPQKKIEAQPSEEQIFSEAMQGVRPLAQDRFVCGSPVRLTFREGTAYKLENDELSRLAKLVDCGAPGSARHERGDGGKRIRIVHEGVLPFRKEGGSGYSRARSFLARRSHIEK